MSTSLSENRRGPRPRILLCWALLAVSPGARGELTLAEAERLALAADPAVVGAYARANALQDQAVADGQLPDPKLGFGAYNVPLDDFSLDREPMTQLYTRVQQAFPRGATLRYQRQHTEWLGKAELARAGLAQREIERDLRTTFLELYYQQQAAGVVERSRELFQQLVTITRSHFATARASQQDVLQAQLELSRLDDRAARIEGDIAEQRAQLARWLGDSAWQPISTSFPSLPDPPALAELEAGLAQHPAVQTASAQLQANQQMVKAAREQYKPGWDVGLEYRKRFAEDARGDDLPDMMAAMVTLDVPLFTGKRQDKRLAASQQNAEAARQLREQRLRELRRALETEYARWKRLGEQERLYRERLVSEASDNSAAALHAYRSGVSEFTTLMRARITELDVRLQDLRLRVDRAKAQAGLLFLRPDRNVLMVPEPGANS
jgi:outer membrane protein TolC